MLTNECTVVTAYYDFDRKKHKSEEYYIWMKYLLNLPCKMVIFVGEQKTNDIVKSYRKSFDNTTKIILLPVEELYCYKMMDYWNKDYHRDHEKFRHDPFLYLIWNEKTNFLKRTKDMNPFDTEFLCWTDIGIIRDQYVAQNIQNFPSSKMLSICDKSKAHLLLINPFTQEEYSSVVDASEEFRHKNRIGAGVILCHFDIVDKFHSLYYKMLHRFMELNLFAGKDQSIVNCLYLLNKDFINLIHPINSPIDHWFYMMHYLSDSYFENTYIIEQQPCV